MERGRYAQNQVDSEEYQQISIQSSLDHVINTNSINNNTKSNNNYNNVFNEFMQLHSQRSS